LCHLVDALYRLKLLVALDESYDSADNQDCQIILKANVSMLENLYSDNKDTLVHSINLMIAGHESVFYAGHYPGANSIVLHMTCKNSFFRYDLATKTCFFYTILGAVKTLVFKEKTSCALYFSESYLISRRDGSRVWLARIGQTNCKDLRKDFWLIDQEGNVIHKKNAPAVMSEDY
jgi:hypothetical protein